MKKRTSFIKLIKLWGIIFLIGIGVSIIAIDFIGAYRDFNSRADQMRTDYIALQKRIIKQEVKRVVKLISYEKAQSELLTKEKIKSRVYEAYSIAQNIYQQNKTAKSESEIQQMILDALRPIRFEGGSGYYFATRLDGVEMLFADKPEMEGLTLLGMQDTRGQYVIKDMIEITKQSGEGFYEYHWTKPHSAGNEFKKISFIKRFEPYEWFIGTGLYVDDVEGQIKANLLSTISRIRFGKEGYIFINRLNGDTLVSNGALISGTKKLWEVFNKNPEKMKDIFDKEINAALKPDGDYIYYTHVKLTTPDRESPKASFIYGIPDLQWIVGAGVYLDDVEADIALMRTKLDNQVKKKLFFFILLVMGIAVLFFLLLNWLNSRLKNDFSLFVSFFNRAAHSDEEIDRETIKFVELDQIAEYANKMLAERKQAESALHLSLEKYEKTFRAAPIWVVLSSLDDGRYMEVNESFLKTLGYKREEVIGRTSLELNAWVDPKDRERIVAQVRETGAIHNTGVQRRTRSGAVIDTLFSAEILQLEDKPVMISVTREITDQKKAEAEHGKLQAQLLQAQKMESVGRLAGGVAHDFNNMLGVILGRTEMMLMEIKPGDPHYADLQEIFKAAQRSADLTRQLLAFARKQAIAPEVLDLNDTVEGMLKMLRRLIGEDIDIVWKPDTHLESVKMDPAQVDQIMANLCVNARDAISGSGKVTIETENVVLDQAYCAFHTGFIPGQYVMLAVSDDGCGMDKVTLENLFEPFFTTKGVGEGTGLGLATVYGIVKQNDGFINVYSEPGQGTTFKIYLPLIQESVAEKGKPVAETIAKGSETILLVEDEASILNLCKAVLEQFGYKVLAARTPELAVAMAERYEGPIHLLITDVVMPEMNGRELMDRIEKLRPHIKVLFMSGYTGNVIVQRGILEGDVHFLQKPFSNSSLAGKAREVLDQPKK